MTRDRAFRRPGGQPGRRNVCGAVLTEAEIATYIDLMHHIWDGLDALGPTGQ